MHSPIRGNSAERIRSSTAVDRAWGWWSDRINSRSAIDLSIAVHREGLGVARRHSWLRRARIPDNPKHVIATICPKRSLIRAGEVCVEGTELTRIQGDRFAPKRTLANAVGEIASGPRRLGTLEMTGERGASRYCLSKWATAALPPAMRTK